jgi:hypothetical protein
MKKIQEESGTSQGRMKEERRQIGQGKGKSLELRTWFNDFTGSDWAEDNNPGKAISYRVVSFKPVIWL